MFNRKLLALILSLSHSSFASSLYFRSGYYGELINQNGLQMKYDKKVYKNTSSPKYSPQFAAGFALGYQGKSKSRFELELLHSQIKKADETKDYSMIGCCSNESANNVEVRITVSDARIENTAFMVNSYYQATSSAYFGAGIGLTRIKIFKRESFRPAYQLKAGINRNINSNMSMYLGYRHFGVIGGTLGEFATFPSKQEDVTRDPGQNSQEMSKKAIIENSFFGTHGIEIGLIVHFATD